MVDLLVLTGIVFIGLALWRGRIQSAREQKELSELKRVREELAEAKKEVNSLLEQLEAVSEKVVEDIAAKVEEARTLQAGNSNIVDAEGSDNPDDQEVADLDGQDDEGDDDGNSESETVNSSGSGSGSNKTDLAVAPVEERFRRSITVLRQNARPKEQAGSKTIIFPGRRDYSSKDSMGTRKEDPAREMSPRHQMVYAMDKLGYSDEEIAKQLKMGKGEVRLMLELKRKGEEANV